MLPSQEWEVTRTRWRWKRAMMSSSLFTGLASSRPWSIQGGLTWHTEMCTGDLSRAVVFLMFPKTDFSLSKKKKKVQRLYWERDIATVWLWRSENNSQESILAFYHVGHGDWTQILNLSKRFFFLSHQPQISFLGKQQSYLSIRTLELYAVQNWLEF